MEAVAHQAFLPLKTKVKKRKRPVKKEKILKDEQGNDIASPRLSDNPSEEGEVKVGNTAAYRNAAVSGSRLQKPRDSWCRALKLVLDHRVLVVWRVKP